MFKIIVLLLTTCLCAIGIYSETANDGFRISPDTYVDDGKQYMEFTCTAYLNEGDQLVWQRGSQSMVFYEKKYGSGFKTIKLTWPLQQSDNDTEIYCARNIKEKNGKFKWVQSKKIPIVFKTVKKTLTDTWGPWVWPVEHVMNNTTLIQLSCWAYLYKNQFVFLVPDVRSRVVHWPNDSASRRKPEARDVLRPINESLAIKKFTDGLRNRRLSTILAAREYTELKEAVRAAQDEELARPSPSQ
ncbi:uncharacterized protein LOC133533679 [Cydia pomonella]|uniref:uncharacterized protein LOC133533679 n=1 Tax=Cydia pomonella TaxID=82600 RepID=UPI002ADDCD93|nr:uncharacterized protein LOC133533679 [Cydia pomonella]